ncbi:MAG: bifunctional hydroxymethylpyrimidine kinase/phosphomethylpyrimidine kinase [Pseudomonadota bacterium]
MKGRVLIIAGSDSSGGAGLQADIKTVTALGGYAMTAVTAITAQNTLGVTAIHPIPVDIIQAQIDACLSDIGADVIKIGMIGSAEIAHALMVSLRAPLSAQIPIVLDPVLVATSGDVLGDDDVVDVILDQLLPRAAIVTPNIQELARLAGRPVATLDAMRTAGHHLMKKMTDSSVVLKGSHLADTDDIINILLGTDREVLIKTPRLDTRHTHGTGCTLASALATGMAQGLSLEDAFRRAVSFVHRAIQNAPGFGAGNGPLNHSFAINTYLVDPDGDE